jgi:hypothetical protein
MQFCEPITATVIFPFIFRLVNETEVTKGKEDRTGYYAGIIVRPFSPPQPCSLQLHCLPYEQFWTGIDLFSRRDSLRPAMGKTIGQDWSQTSRVDWAFRPLALDALFRTFTDLPRSGRQPVPCRSPKRQRRCFEIHDGRNYR